MRISSLGLRALVSGALFIAALSACGGGGGSTSSLTPSAPATPGSAPVAPSFTTIAGAPSTLTGASQSLALPTVPGVSTVGGTVGVQSTGSGGAALMLASTSAAGSSAGPPTSLARVRKHNLTSFGSSTITPVYYIGINNTSNTAIQVSFTTMTLTLPPLTSGWSYALACYDPSNPSNGWNEDCAFGSQVTMSGSSATFTLNRTFTIYPGVTLWFAPYAYETEVESTPSPAPTGSPIVPTPAPAPASISGTYVGNANGESDSQYLEFSLTQTGSNVTGIYAVVPDGKDDGSFGTLSGTISGGTLSLTATQQYGGNCGNGTITATVNGVLINGTFTPTTSPTCGAGGNAGGATFSAALQSGITTTLSGTFKGTINDAHNGAGMLEIAIQEPGTVFGGTASVTWTATSQSDSGALVGFMVNSTTAQFAVITNGECAPNGTISISGTTLNGTYNEIGGANSNCSGSGTFTVSQ